MSELADRTKRLTLEESHDQTMTPTTRSQTHLTASGIRYDLSSLDPNSRARAIRGLDIGDQITVSLCREVVQEGTHYGFQIDGRDAKRFSIRIGNENSGFLVPSCSCGANVRGMACEHIFWLEDRVVASASRRPALCGLLRDGSLLSGRPPFELIRSIGFSVLANRHGWLIAGVPEEEEIDEEQDESDLEESEDEEDEVEEEINDMLSVFEPSGALPDEFKRDDFGADLSPRSQVYKRFGNVVKEYAVQDEGMLNHLREIIRPDFRANVFFDKMRLRAERAFGALNEYIRRGPTSPNLTYDVVQCARVLIRLVQDIESGLDNRVRNNPRQMEAANRATAALLYILQGIANRNFDAYSGITWNRLAAVNEPVQNRNLYILLVGTPPRISPSQGVSRGFSPPGGLFVVDLLQRFPRDVIKNHLEQLTIVTEKVALNGAPDAFIKALRDILTSYDSRKRPTSDTQGSSSKKPVR